MALVITNAGENTLLDWALRSTGEALTLRLYVNDYTPTATSAWANFTEASFGGYAVKTLTRASWVAPTTNVAGAGSISYAAQQWSATGAATVYGYYVCTAGNVVVWAQRFSVPRVLTSGAVLTLTPSFTLASA